LLKRKCLSSSKPERPKAEVKRQPVSKESRRPPIPEVLARESKKLLVPAVPDGALKKLLIPVVPDGASKKLLVPEVPDGESKKLRVPERLEEHKSCSNPKAHLALPPPEALRSINLLRLLADRRKTHAWQSHAVPKKTRCTPPIGDEKVGSVT
jgi:hypothetical protein